MEFRRVLFRARSVHFRNNSRSALTICFNSWHSITFAVIIRGTTTLGMSERGHELKQLRQLKEIRLRGAEAYYDLGVAYSVGRSSDEGRDGKEGDSKCRYRWMTYPNKKKT